METEDALRVVPLLKINSVGGVGREGKRKGQKGYRNQ
jgi:hypothetical protein